MNPSDTKLIPLEIITDPEAWITVFDGFDRTASAPQRGGGTLQLSPGIYTVNCERAGQALQQTIRHSERRRLTIYPPAAASAAPLTGASNTHEYYGDPSRHWSVTPTAPPMGSSEPGWIFVFIRAWGMDEHLAGENPGERFELTDATGRTMARFSDPSITAQDPRVGFTAFSAFAGQGHYQLRYLGSEPWAMPLDVVRERATQVFVLFHHKPLVQSVRVFFRVIGMPFDPADVEAADTDLALTGLANGIEAAGRALPRQHEMELLVGKFQDPMLGLIGAHWLLARRDASAEYASVVLHNLRRLLPGSSDVLALEFLAARRWPGVFVPPSAPAEFPPMLGASLRALREEPDRTIAPKSLLERILVRLQAGSPWVMWRVDTAADGRALRSGAPQASNEDGWVQRVVLQRLSAPPAEPTAEALPLDNQLAAELRLPVRVVARADERLRRFAELGSANVPLRSDRLAGESDGQVEVGRVKAWIWRAAVLLDEPFPSLKSGVGVFIPLSSVSGEPIALQGRNPVYFRSSGGENGVILYRTLQSLLYDLDPSGAVQSSFAAGGAEGARYLLFRWAYDLERVEAGDLGLGGEWPLRGSPMGNYFIACPVPEHWGAGYALQRCVSRWMLPIQLASAEDLGPGQVLFVDLPGSLQYRFLSLARLTVDRGESATGPRVGLDTVVSAAGIFRLVIRRPSGGGRTLELRVFQTPLAPPPVVSVGAAAMGYPSGGRISVEQLVKLAPQVGEAASRIASQHWSRIFSERLTRAVREPLLQGRLDFAAQPEAAAAVLRLSVEGHFDGTAAQWEGDLPRATSEGMSIDVHVMDRTASVVEPDLGGGIIVRPPNWPHADCVAKILFERAVQPSARPLQTTWSARFREPPRWFVKYCVDRLAKRFVSSSAGLSRPLKTFLDSAPLEAGNLSLSVDLFWPAGVETSWGSPTAAQASALSTRLAAEMRFWTPLFALTEASLLNEVRYLAPFLVYGALPPQLDPRRKWMSLSPEVWGNLVEVLLGFRRAGVDNVSVPEFIREAERSPIFQSFLATEDRVRKGVTWFAGEDPGSMLYRVLSLVASAFGEHSGTMAAIVLGSGAVQLSEDPDLIPGAALKLNLLRGVFGPRDLPAGEPPLAQLIAQLTVTDLKDSLKPFRVGARVKKENEKEEKENEKEEEEGSSGASGAAGAD